MCPVSGAESVEIAYAISTIFVFNLAAVLPFPPLGHLLGLGQHQFGLCAPAPPSTTPPPSSPRRTTYGTAAGHYAVVVKLTRTLDDHPDRARAGRSGPAPGGGGVGGASLARVEEHVLVRSLKLVPWFLIGFLVMAAGNTIGVIPASSHAPLQQVSLFLITVALSAIGLSTDVRRSAVPAPGRSLLGGMLWLAVTATSLLLQWAGS